MDKIFLDKILSRYGHSHHAVDSSHGLSSCAGSSIAYCGAGYCLQYCQRYPDGHPRSPRARRTEVSEGCLWQREFLTEKQIQVSDVSC